jgi:hypothetical protein
MIDITPSHFNRENKHALSRIAQICLERVEIEMMFISSISVAKLT